MRASRTLLLFGLAPILSGLALSLSGCVGASFNPYVGQQAEWPTGRSSVVSTQFGIPIYKSLPNRPYDVLGEITLEKSESIGANLDMRSPLTRILKKAKEIHADALVVVEPRTFFRTALQEVDAKTKPAAQPETYTGSLAEIGRGNLSVIAIRWRRIVQPTAAQPETVAPEKPQMRAEPPIFEPVPASPESPP